MADNLLPCPFCGGAAKIITPGSEGGVDVGCLPNPGCGARLRFFGNAKSAARYWNRRTAPMEAVAWRVRDKDDPRGWWLYGVHETETVAELKRQEHEVQALAVIPTEGGEGLKENDK